MNGGSFISKLYCTKQCNKCQKIFHLPILLEKILKMLFFRFPTENKFRDEYYSTELLEHIYLIYLTIKLYLQRIMIPKPVCIYKSLLYIILFYFTVL